MGAYDDLLQDIPKPKGAYDDLLAETEKPKGVTFKQSFDKGVVNLGVLGELATGLLDKGISKVGEAFLPEPQVPANNMRVSNPQTDISLADSLRTYQGMPSSPIFENMFNAYESNSGINALIAPVTEAVTSPVDALKYLTEMLPAGMVGGGAGGVIAKPIATQAAKTLALNQAKTQLAKNLATGAGVNAGATLSGGIGPNIAGNFESDLNNAIDLGTKQTLAESAVAGVMGSPLNVGANSLRNVALKALGLSTTDEALQTLAGNSAIGKDTTGGELAASFILGGMGAPADIAGATLFKDNAQIQQPSTQDTTAVVDALSQATQQVAPKDTLKISGKDETDNADDATAAQLQAEYEAQTGTYDDLLSEIKDDNASATIEPNTAELVTGTSGLEPNNDAGSAGDTISQPDSISADVAEPPAPSIESDMVVADAVAEPNVAVTKKSNKPKKTSGTLLAKLRNVGGISLSEKLDVTGQDKGFAPGGYNQVFRSDSNKSLKGVIESGDLDEYLPPAMRLSTNTINDDAYDSTEAYDYLSERIRNGERVLPFDVEEEVRLNKLYADEGVQGDIEILANEISDDELNALLKEAGYDERESINEAQDFEQGITTSDITGSERVEAGKTSDNTTETRAETADLLGEDTRAKQAIADAERAKDAKRNTGNGDTEGFTLTGSNSEADKAAANGAQDLFAQINNNTEPTPKQSSTIQDLGEKIGGARKDTALKTGTSPKQKSDNDDKPTWAKRFEISQIVASSKPDEVGKWSVSDTKKKDWLGNPKKAGIYETKEEAEKVLPLLALSLKHSVYATAKREDGTYGYEIYRNITDRKRVKVVNKIFENRSDALVYMAENAEKILETNTTFGEIDLPRPESTTRVGTPRRTGDVEGDDFMKTFGFRGVEFGNWNNQDERQELMNDAYDGLLDLSEVMNIPPRAISLNGDLALAFGARGQGLSSAKAHYERGKAVINLTKMNGAGSLAHEWFHALDHYFGRQDGKAKSEWLIDDDGTKSLKVSASAESDYLTGGVSYKSNVRKELSDAYIKFIKTMVSKGATYVEDTEKVDAFVNRTREDLAKLLDNLRGELSRQKDEKFYKRNNKPASAEQLVEFDTIVKQILDGTGLETELRMNDGKSRFGTTRVSNDLLDGLSAIYKAVRGRSGFDSTNQRGVLDNIRYAMSRYKTRLEMLKEAEKGEEKVKQVPTDFVMNAKELDQGRGGDYWTTPHELGARAFQAYVEDKIDEKGGSSPFLNYAPQGAGIETPWGFKYVFPRGEERNAINKAIEEFVGKIKTKETDDGNIAMFSNNTSTGYVDVDALAKAIKKEFGNAVNVIETMEQAPLDVRYQALSEGATGVEGFYYSVENSVYVVAENIPDIERGIEVARHELIGHYGMENMLGKELMGKLINRVLEAEKSGNKVIKDMAKHVDETQPNLSQRRRAKEIIAVMAERNLQNGIVKRVLDAIRIFLRKKGFLKSDVTDAKVAGLLREAEKYLKAQGRSWVEASDTSFSNSKPITTDTRDNWLFRRDELGRIQLNPTGKAYDAIANVTQIIADKASFGMANPELRKLIRHFKADMSKALETAGDVAKKMAPMSAEDRALVSDVVENMVKTGVVPPDYVTKIATGMQATMDALTDELVKLGMLNKDAAERWRGKYLPRFYNREKDPALTTWASKLLRSAIPLRGMGGGSLKGRGMHLEIDVKELPSWEALGWEVRDNLWKKNRQGKLELIDKNKVRDTEKVMIWRDYSPEERERMGEIRDALFRFVMGYTAMQNDIALGRMYDTIAKNQEWTRSRPSEGYVKVPDSEIPETGGVKRYGNLAGLYIREDILQHINQYEESSELWKYYRKALSFWKMGKTVLNPVSHMNNVVSNLTMSHFAGVSYWDSHKYVGALRDFVNNAPMIQEAKDVGLMTGDITRAELISEMPDDIKAMLDQRDSQIKKSVKTTYNILTFGLTKPMSKAYRFEDDFFKYLIYRDARANGLSPDDAVDYATRYIFNYDDLPANARKVRDLAIPFFAYTYKAIPALAHTAFNYPWRFAAPAMAIGGINALMFGLAAGDDDDDLQTKLAKGKELEAEERKDLPPWMQGKSALGTQKAIRLGHDEVTNLPIYMDISRMIPGGDVFDVTNQSDGVPLFAPLMPSNPVLTSLAAMIWNKDTFSGKEVTDINDTPEEAAKKRGEWMLRQISPAIAPTGYHADRLMQAGAYMADTTIETPFKDYTGYGKDGLPVQPKFAGLNTIGIKARPVDLELSADIAEGKDKKELSSLKSEARQLSRMLQNKAVSQREYDRRIAELREKIQAIREKP